MERTKQRRKYWIICSDPDKMPLSKCLNAPWINGQCDGVPVVGRMFSREPCRNCEKHAPTKAEATLEANMAAVDGTFKLPTHKGYC